MAPSNPLYVGTQALMRLVDEQISYHKELEQQTSRLDKLQREQNAHKLKKGEDDGNQDYMLRQQRKAIDETKAVLPTLKHKIADALAKLEGLLAQEADKGSESDVQLINNAKNAVARAKTTLRETS